MFYPKSKNCLALESTILESTPKGIKGWIKKVFLSRISTVFASGNLHVELLEALNFKGDIKITKGVGIINKPTFENVKKEYQKRFLYIGRFSRVKNLETLIKVFNELPNHHLTIIGDGEEKEYLKSIANQNISFKSPIENSKLQNEFLNHVEKEQIIDSLDSWIELREIRNELEHDYPEELKETLVDLKFCIDNFTKLESYYLNALQFSKKYLL